MVGGGGGGGGVLGAGLKWEAESCAGEMAFKH